MSYLRSIFLALVIFAGLLSATPAKSAQYLVNAQNGPSFNTPEEAVEVLETVIFPLFDALIKLEEEGAISGGLPLGDRAFCFVMEAKDNFEADRILRDLPGWPLLDWDVTPLQSIAGRYEQERNNTLSIHHAGK